MTVSNDTPQPVTLVAVDIAKNYHDVLIQPPPPGRRRRMRVANNRQDFEHLAGYLRGLRSSVVIGFEATGNYQSTAGVFSPRAWF
jgi:transposase